MKGRANETYFSAVGGGLWKTTDAGNNWAPVTDNQIRSSSVGAVAVSESNPDVVFIGMTDENGPLVPTVKSYLKATGIEWMNAYGAYPTIAKLGVEFIPYVWVVDSTGMIAWTTDSDGAIEDGIRLALDHKEKLMAKK